MVTGSPCMFIPLATTRSARLVSIGQAGQRQAALLAVLRLVGEVEARVDQVADHVVDAVGEDPQRDPDLRGGQADAGGVHHRLGEVGDQCAQLLVEGRRPARPACAGRGRRTGGSACSDMPTF